MVTDAVRTAAENIVQPMPDAIIERRERYLAVATALQTAVPVAIVEFADGALSAALSHIQHPTVGRVTSPAGKPRAENEALAGKTTGLKAPVEPPQRRHAGIVRTSKTSSRSAAGYG